MKYNKTNIILAAIVFALFLYSGYMIVTGGMFSNAEMTDTTSVGTSSVEEYNLQKQDRIAQLTKRNLFDEVVGVDEYGILEDFPVVDTQFLLATDGWEESGFGTYNLFVKLPQDGWYRQAGSSTNQIVITTTESGEPEGDAPWARIVIGEYSRTQEQSLFDWMREPTIEDGTIAPPSDTTIQYVSIGESTFLGSAFFKESLWTGTKNVYAEVEADAIFAASLEVQNLTPQSKELGSFDQVFYTILESLEVK